MKWYNEHTCICSVKRANGNRHVKYKDILATNFICWVSFTCKIKQKKKNKNILSKNKKIGLLIQMQLQQIWNKNKIKEYKITL